MRMKLLLVLVSSILNTRLKALGALCWKQRLAPAPSPQHSRRSSFARRTPQNNAFPNMETSLSGTEKKGQAWKIEGNKETFRSKI